MLGLLVIFLILFYGLQRFIVYGQDGVHLEFTPRETEPQSDLPPVLPGTGVQAEIVYDAPDYSTLDLHAGQGLSPMRAMYLSADRISPASLEAVKALMDARGANALVLEMKSPKGELSWKSDLPLAVSYDVNGEADLAPQLAALKEQGVYLAAKISVCRDTNMAQRNVPLALKTANGMVYTDTEGSWLDPSNTEVRLYTAAVAESLLSLGFDEIILADFVHPAVPAGTELRYAQTSSVGLTPRIVLSAFALDLRNAVDARGGRLSAYCDADSFRAGNAETTGQDPDLFGKAFDRLCFPTSPYTYASDTELLAWYMPREELPARFVAVTDAPGSAQSYISN